MSEKNNPPSEYFNGIYYNPSFFQDNTDISLEFGSKNLVSLNDFFSFFKMVNKKTS